MLIHKKQLWEEIEAAVQRINANVIREGRSNPTVPIVMIGIEPDEIFE